MVLKLAYYPEPILMKKTLPVKKFDAELHQLLDSMKETMLAHKGIGLSANQVFRPLSIFVMKSKRGEFVEFINPIIEEMEPEPANIREGCLSAPNVYERIGVRSNQVTVKALDRHGNEFRSIWLGLDAVCVQHEVDHLNGVFWFSRAPSRQTRRRLERSWEKEKKKLGLS